MHAPPGYSCPFCAIAARIHAPGAATDPHEVVLHTSLVTAFICSHQWPNNPGHVLVVPNEHFENLYELPARLAEPLQGVTQRIALALKAAHGCAGISTRQHNEPAGNQDVWHYHVHVFPRYPDDGLYGSQRAKVALETRLEQATLLRRYLDPT